MDKLQQHPWPGNIRELRNVVHRALLLRRGPKIDASDISFDQEYSREPTGAAGISLEMPVGPHPGADDAAAGAADHREHHAPLQLQPERVAKELGLARSTLFKRLKDWGISRSEEESE